MGVIRGVLIVVISVILFLSLISVGLLNISSSSLESENVQKNVAPILVGTLLNNSKLIQEINLAIPSIQASCSKNPDYSYSFNKEGFNFQISCELVKRGAVGMIIQEGNNQLEKSPFFSKQFKDSLDKYFYYSLLLCCILVILLFFLVETKSNSFFISGILTILSAFVVLVLAKFVVPFLYKIFFNVTQIGLSIPFDSILVGVSSSFIWLCLIGVLFIIVGFILKLFSFGFSVQEFFSKFKSSSSEKKKEVIEKQPEEKPVVSKSKKKTKKSKNKRFLLD